MSVVRVASMQHESDERDLLSTLELYDLELSRREVRRFVALERHVPESPKLRGVVLIADAPRRRIGRGKHLDASWDLRVV